MALIRTLLEIAAMGTVAVGVGMIYLPASVIAAGIFLYVIVLGTDEPDK